MSALNIWSSFASRRKEQEREVRENSTHPKIVWLGWEHTGWGDSISFTNWETRRLMGHTNPLPAIGDELHFRMQSGKVGNFVFVKVEPCVDPSDMWFATVQDNGYVDAL